MNTNEILESIRADQAESNIKYSNIKYERRNKKDVIQISAGTPPDSQIVSVSTPSAPLDTSTTSTSSSPLSPIGDIAALVPLRGGTTSSAAIAAQEVVKASSGPDVHYAKVTTRRPTKTTNRRKINFDFNVRGSNKMNKLTFATTDKYWEWIRDIKEQYEAGQLAETDWIWYQQVGEIFKQAKQEYPRTTIGKGCRRGNKKGGQLKTVKLTAAIYTGEAVSIYVGNWQNVFELEAIMSGPASVHHDYVSEYRNQRTDYVDLSWE